MRICFPVQEAKGLESNLDMNIMTAKAFLIVDTQTNEIKVIPRGGLNPVAPLEKEMFEFVVVMSIGKMAVQKFNEKRKRVYKCHGMTVAKNVDMMKRHQLQEIRPEQCT